MGCANIFGGGGGQEIGHLKFIYFPQQIGRKSPKFNLCSAVTFIKSWGGWGDAYSRKHTLLNLQATLGGREDTSREREGDDPTEKTQCRERTAGKPEIGKRGG